MKLNLKGNLGWVLGVVGVVVVAVAAWSFMRGQSRPAAPSAVMPAPSTSAGATTTPGTSAAPGPVTVNPAPLGVGTATLPGPAGVAPKAWDYDPTTNRYFDPNHGHWHDGPPPPPEARGGTSVPPPTIGTVPLPNPVGAAPTTPTPAPWTYDAEKNQHWDPNHGHWHPGRPPAGAR